MERSFQTLLDGLEASQPLAAFLDDFRTVSWDQEGRCVRAGAKEVIKN
jgi:hypothetical protein